MICQGCNRPGAKFFTELYEPDTEELATIWLCHACQLRFYATAMLMAPGRGRA